MLAEFLSKVLDIAKPEMHTVKDVHGVETVFSTKPLHQIQAEAPKQAPGVPVSTLKGFADLVHAKLEDGAFQDDFVIHVQDEATVTLKSRKSDDYGRRLTLIQAKPVPFDQFKFGTWVDQETFAIAVASLFADNEDKAYVLKVASILTNEAVGTTEDDGFTQRVNVKAGLLQKAVTTLKPRVALAPFRTFPEVTQPVSDFVFRARGGDSGATLMLVEADGGRWKIDAIETLRKAMEAYELGIPIVA